MIWPIDRLYLKSRGYTDELIEEEGWCSLAPGRYVMGGVVVVLTQPAVGILCIWVEGTITALQTLSISCKNYRKYRTEAGNYLPVYLASENDYKLWESSGEVALVEGIFDRVAMKRAAPDLAVFAMLGLGVSEKMTNHLARFSKRVWLVLDQDGPGKSASERVEKALRLRGTTTERLVFPYKDPGEYMEKRGLERMKVEIAHARNLQGW